MSHRWRLLLLPPPLPLPYKNHTRWVNRKASTSRPASSKCSSTMAVPPLIPLLTLASVFPFLAIPSSANDSNVLLTGDVLGADEQLSYGAATFVMQRDCNLVHYVEGRRVFQSYTRGHGVNRTLSLTDCGQLVITSSLGSSIVWRSPFLRGANRGKYAAVLRPDGVVAIYGPAVWSTPDYGFGAALVHEGWTHALPAAKNVLFSSEMLYENAKLVTRDYSLLMKDDCNLVLVKASVGVIWQSGTAGRGLLHCFLRIDHRGQLAVASDDYYKNLWSSNNASSIGDYALLLQINGQAVVYGPTVWLITSSPKSLLDTTSSSPEPPIAT
ncbi:mannose-specific lectin 3-like [Musa acuminata AAA Group]|uniref:mannose-specific lectin 3-like n=1 Tax=Musa acuminata AAA Group TaxID=214697 RepID=UPI0031DABEC0